VRALRDRGLEAWGIDHSRWAVDQAEPAVRPFLLFTDATDADEERQFDLVVAMSILESLTEEQIRRLLPRARRWTRQAIFATIPAADRVADRSRGEDRDLSHITMRPRAWWHERFEEAGWRQDPMHRCFERLCQSHQLPTTMGWNVFVFSPGS